MLLLSDFVHSDPSAPPVEKCYALLRGEDLMQVHSNAISLVLGRDLRRNVLYASTMALELAASGKKVFYLNTYASEHLLRFAFSAAATVAEVAGATEPADGADPGSRIWLESLATGQWNAATLREAITGQGCEVLIVNSFEFAELSRYRRERVARDLIDLQRALSLTVIVFSHEIKLDLEAHCAGRGAIGTLAAVAESVSKVGDEWRPTNAPLPAAPAGQIDEENPQKLRVHEKQTLNKNFLPRKFGGQRPNPSVDLERDYGFSYHYGDFWEDPFHRGPMVSYLGKDMSLFARTPMLQKYLLDHPDAQFMIGNTPTEAELRAKAGIIGPVEDVLSIEQVHERMMTRQPVASSTLLT